jgi:2-oxo-4-hydroxy-4-carboxy--5-ureidoimidazoline (OHCU) decarboxylase
MAETNIAQLLCNIFTEVKTSSELRIILQHPDKAVSLPIPGGHWRIL